MADETAAAPDPATPATPRAARKLVTLATDHGHVFKPGADLPEITPAGATVTSDQADEIRTVARKMGINITAKDA